MIVINWKISENRSMIFMKSNKMTKKQKYYAISVGIDSSNELFVTLPNGETVYITPEQLFQLKELYETSRE